MAENKTAAEELTVLQEGLEKSLSDLRARLNAEPLSKSKSPAPGTTQAEEMKEGKRSGNKDASDDEEIESEYGDDDEEEDLTDMEDVEQKGKLAKKPWSDAKKSLPDMISNDSDEAAIAMDVEPFLRSLAKSIQKYLDFGFAKLEKSLGASISASNDLSKGVADVLLKSIDLQNKVLEQPLPIGSALRKSGDRFDGANKQLDRSKILQKSHQLVMERKISTLDASKIEARLNHGQELGEYAPLFKDAE